MESNGVKEGEEKEISIITEKIESNEKSPNNSDKLCPESFINGVEVDVVGKNGDCKNDNGLEVVETAMEKSEEKNNGKKEEVVGVETKLPILEAPIVLSPGVKRSRSKVERLDVSSSSITAADGKSKVTEIPEGRGQKLGDIGVLQSGLRKARDADCKILHQVCFGKPGSLSSAKGSVRQFCGFAFDPASPEYVKKLLNVSGKRREDLKVICGLLGLSMKTTVKETAAVIVDALMCPAEGSFGKSKASRKSGGKAKAPQKKKKKKEEEEKELEEGKESELSSISDSSEGKEVNENKSKKRVVRKKKEESLKPSDREIEEKVREIIKASDLDSITIKTVINDVMKHFGGDDLSKRRNSIKSMIKKVIAQ